MPLVVPPVGQMQGQNQVRIRTFETIQDSKESYGKVMQAILTASSARSLLAAR